MLHHHQRVGTRGELAQDLDQPLGVARMQPGGGLIEHVERVGQVGAERVGQLDPLCLAARERAREPVERQVAEVHAQQEPQPRLQFAERRAGDDALRLAELKPGEEHGGVLDGQRAHLGDALAAQRHVQRLGPQPPAATVRARARHLVALDDEPVAGLVRLLLQPLEERDHAAEVLAALDQQPPVLGGQGVPRRVQRHALLGGELLEPRPRHRAPRTRPGRQYPLAQRLGAVRHDQLEREREHVAEPLARGAHAERAVEREQRRLRAHGGRTAICTLPALTTFFWASGPGTGAGPEHQLEPALAAAERLFAGLDQPLTLVGPPLEAVHHHAHLPRRALELRDRVERHHLAADPRARVAGAQQVAGLLVPRQLLGQRDRRQHQHGLLARPVGRLAGDRLRRVGAHLAAALAAVDAAQPGEHQAQVVVDLGRGADRGADAAGGGALLDAHRGRQPGDGIHVGARQPIEKLLGVGTDRLDVTALALRI